MNKQTAGTIFVRFSFKVNDFKMCSSMIKSTSTMILHRACNTEDSFLPWAQKQWFMPSFSILSFCLRAALLTLSHSAEERSGSCSHVRPQEVRPGLHSAMTTYRMGLGGSAALYPLKSARGRFPSKACPRLADTVGRRALYITLHMLTLLHTPTPLGCWEM